MLYGSIFSLVSDYKHMDSTSYILIEQKKHPQFDNARTGPI